MPIVRGGPFSASLPLPRATAAPVTDVGVTSSPAASGSCPSPQVWQSSMFSPGGGYCMLPQSILSAPAPAGSGLTISGPVQSSPQYGPPVSNIQIAAYNQALSMGMDPASVIGPNGTVIGPLAAQYNAGLSPAGAAAAGITPAPAPAVVTPTPVLSPNVSSLQASPVVSPIVSMSNVGASSAPPPGSTTTAGIVPQVQSAVTNIGSVLTESSFFGLPNWVWLAGAALFLMRGK